MTFAPLAAAAHRPLFGHHSVPLGRHWLGVTAATAVAALMSGVAASLALALMSDKGFAFIFWGGWLSALLVAFAALPLVALGFTATRMILTPLHNNFGLAYAGVGLALALLATAAGITDPNRAPFLLAEAGATGIAAGLIYWRVACPVAAATDAPPEIVAAAAEPISGPLQT